MVTIMNGAASEQVVSDYLIAHSTAPDDVLRDLAAETRQSFPDAADMQISSDEGALLTLLVRISGARDVIEIGTFTGYSSICLARGLPADGHLLACDVSGEWTDVARRYWARAGVADRIELRLGPAAETLAALPETEQFDLAFVDADKPSYPGYYEALVPRLRSGGLLLLDNVLLGGLVYSPGDGDTRTGPMRTVNDAIAADERLESVMLPVRDGVTLARKR